ncbi:hypothetical protein [Dyella subtropica]|uniref:hypothetical protein n=1 Tax=Dyella subtropica TaxID=2992127 RepID=UPI002259197A|nr:hypothetical protein [Dyella subtropica]
MLSECTGPVTAAELQELVVHVRDLRDRAAEHGQTFLSFALELAADSMADNVETTMDMDAPSDD